MKRYLLAAALATCACHHTIRDRPGVKAQIPETQPPQALPHSERPPAYTAPPEPTVPRDPPPPPVHPDIDQLIVATNGRLLDAFFPYDRSGLDDAAMAALRGDADILRPLLAEFPQLQITVEGHCDERGSAEYNLGLGDHRARRAAAFLEQLRIPADRIATVSYGKESPQCAEPAESCWSRNRRAHLSVRAAAPATVSFVY